MTNTIIIILVLMIIFMLMTDRSDETLVTALIVTLLIGFVSMLILGRR